MLTSSANQAMTQSRLIPIEIRRARAAEAPAIARFTRAIALETENIHLDANQVMRGVAAVFEDPRHGFYVVALSEKAVVGCLLVTYEWSDWRNGVQWWLQSVYVDPEFRRKAVFSKLYRFTIDVALQHDNVCGIHLYADRRNQAAIKAYTRLGMNRTEYRIFEIERKSLILNQNSDQGEFN